MKDPKFKLLRNGILYDFIGMSSMFIPVIGPFLDVIWAPIAAKKMSEMYKGNEGKIASIIVFIEELLPLSDFIPTFTLMWIYTFVLSSQKENAFKSIKVEGNE